MSLLRSAHIDTFTRDHLPPEKDWPILEFTLPELQYPERLNVAEVLLDEAISRFGSHRTAMIAPGGKTWGSPEAADTYWTYNDLRQRVNQVARLLTEDYGIIPGNRVLIRLPNNPWAVILWFAIIKAGAVAVTTMTAWRESELQKLFHKTLPALAIVDYRFLEGTSGLRSETPLLVLGGPGDQIILASAKKPLEFSAVLTSADDVALLGPTSGSTGEPKVTAHFHRDVLAIADTFARHTLRLGPNDVSAGSPPLAFTFGLGGLVVFPARTGGAALLLERPTPTALAKAIDPYGITVLYTAPSGYRAILKAGLAPTLSNLRVGVSAGEHLPLETFKAVETEAGLRLVNGIGATEMLHVFISAADKEIRPGAIGTPVPGFRATLLDEAGHEVLPGQPGRLAVIGPTGCRYLNDPRQLDYVQHGWNLTGDTFIRDQDGYFFYQGRSDDIIITAGYNVGAPEVEAALDLHPNIIESAVVSRPDPEKGAIVNAFIVLADGVLPDDATRQSIQNFVNEQLATYKAPRRIDFVDALPRNPSGKVQRFLLRQFVSQEALANSAPTMTDDQPST